MGNRGCLHDAGRRLTASRWDRKQWVICELTFGNRHRVVMSPGKYTELFFLDEATALAAGHRPCGRCRKNAYNRFLGAWDSLLPGAGGGVAALDAALHSQRSAVIGKSKLPEVELAAVPSGCMIALETGGEPYLVYQGHLRKWTFGGYIFGPDIAADIRVVLITPVTAKEIIASGYQPQMHPSAGAVPTLEQSSLKLSQTYPAAHPNSRSKSEPVSVRKPLENNMPISKVKTPALFRLDVTPRGRNLYAYFAAILQVTGMDRGESYPLRKFMRNFSGHEAAGRIVKVGSEKFRLTEAGVAYFCDRFRAGNPQHITQAEVDHFKHCILHGGGKGWARVE